MENKDIFAFLSIDGEQKLVGTRADKNIKYSADYDLKEKKTFKKTSDIYFYIFNLFREKYKEALQNPNIWIVDLKAGMFRGQPIKWNKEEIKRGYKNIDSYIILFTDCLQQDSIIKLDIIAIDKEHNITEYSDIYRIKVGDLNLTQFQPSKEEEAKSLLNDVYSKVSYKKYFKALRRLYQYAIIIKNNKLQEDLLTIMNSSLGEDYKIMSDLDTLLKLLEQKFKPVNKEIILTHLKMMKINVNEKRIKPSLEEIIKDMNTDINKKLKPIIKSNKNIYIYFASFF